MIISAQCPACNETSGSFSVATNKFFPSYLCVFSFWFYAYIYSIMYNCLAPKLSLNRTMPTKGPIWTRSTIPCSRSSSLRFYHPLKKKKKENIQIGPRVVSKQRESVSTLEVPLALFRNVHASIYLSTTLQWNVLPTVWLRQIIVFPSWKKKNFDRTERRTFAKSFLTFPLHPSGSRRIGKYLLRLFVLWSSSFLSSFFFVCFLFLLVRFIFTYPMKWLTATGICFLL